MDSVTFDEPDDDEARALRAGAGLADLSGRQIGRYLVGQQLGTGGAATVYRAYDQVQGITVALKLLLPGADEKTYTRFRREATLAGALRHPHIVRILQIGIAPKGEVAYIAMELVEGESLADLLAQRGRLRPEETANLLEPIARALAFAHGQGVVHRDVKPGNILLRPVSPGAANSVQLESLEHPVVPLLSDFGIARALDTPELTSAGRTVGTPAYMAPEQCAGSREVDGRADLYSLGAVLYRCVTGRLPYSGTTTQILHAHVYEPLTIDVAVLRLLPPLVVEVIQRSMAKRPEDRYADADALADALALAAGRIPPLQGSSPGESTATLTLSALPAVPPEPARPETTVLVPGVGSAVTGTTTAAAATTTNPLLRPAARRPDEAPPAAAPSPEHAHQLIPDPGEGVGRLERLNWPGIALTSVLGLLLLAAAVAFGIQGPGLLARLGGPPTPLPTPGDVSQAPATPTLQPGVVVTSTATPVPSPTALPATATATLPVPTSTLTPTPLPPPPTDTPEPTATPTETPTVTPTASPTLTPTPSVTPGPHPDLVACLDRIDPSLQSHILGKDPGYQVALGCPDQPALAGMAFVLPFERGYLVGFDMTPEMLAVYPGNNTWERLFVPEEGQGSPEGETAPSEQLYVPTGRFGWVWSQNERQAALGYALQPEPGFFNARYQTFPGALLLANLDSGEIVELPISQQR